MRPPSSGSRDRNAALWTTVQVAEQSQALTYVLQCKLVVSERNFPLMLCCVSGLVESGFVGQAYSWVGGWMQVDVLMPDVE